jgi:hypothetical protein
MTKTGLGDEKAPRGYQASPALKGRRSIRRVMRLGEVAENCSSIDRMDGYVTVIVMAMILADQ